MKFSIGKPLDKMGNILLEIIVFLTSWIDIFFYDYVCPTCNTLTDLKSIDGVCINPNCVDNGCAGVKVYYER